MSSSAATPAPVLVSRPPNSLAERFWSLAKGMDDVGPNADPTDVVRAVLTVLDQLETGAVGRDVTVNTLSFLALLRQHEVRGDLLYASPEQARGESMDERSLVFSVGVLLFERLTGRHPFGAEGNPNRVARIRRGEIASGVNFFPKVPSDLRTVLVKAMGPFPEERYESLSALRAELEMFLAHANDDHWHVEELPLPDMRTRPSQQRPLARPPRQALASQALASQGLASLPDAAVPPPDAAVPKPVAEHHTERVFNASLAPPNKWKPIALVAVGAILGAGAFALASSGNSEAPVAAAAAPTPTPEPTPAVIPEPAPAPTPVADTATATATDTAPATVTDTATAPATDTVTAPATDTVTVTTPDTFDIDYGGTNALAAARTCFTEKRTHSGLQFGVSLVYGKTDGLSRKLYWGPTPMLEPDEKSCLSDALLGISAGAPPSVNTVVLHRLVIRDGHDKVKSRVE